MISNMKIVEPQVELWKQEPTLKGAWHQIAKATRVCYQSKPREGESGEDFVKRIILKPALIEGNWLKTRLITLLKNII